jgi:hypothetical protein
MADFLKTTIGGDDGFAADILGRTALLTVNFRRTVAAKPPEGFGTGGGGGGTGTTASGKADSTSGIGTSGSTGVGSTAGCKLKSDGETTFKKLLLAFSGTASVTGRQSALEDMDVLISTEVFLSSMDTAPGSSSGELSGTLLRCTPAKCISASDGTYAGDSSVSLRGENLGSRSVR